MAEKDRDNKYLESLEKGSFSKEERLGIAKGTTFEGTPTPPKTLARLCVDPDLMVRVEAKKSILRLDEPSLVTIAADKSTPSDILLFLAKHFHNSPAVGTAIIGNKNTTEKVLYYLQGDVDESGEEIERSSIGGGAGQEVEFEVEDIIGRETARKADDDIQVTVELDNSRDTRGGFLERERYSDDDMEVVIGVQEGEEEVLEDRLLKRTIAGETPLTGEGFGSDGLDVTIGESQIGAKGAGGTRERDFPSALDAIEGRMDDVFSADSNQQTKEQRESFITELGDEIEMESMTHPSGAGKIPTPGAVWGGREASPVRPDISTEDRTGPIPAKVVMDETRKEVAVSTGKFVTRLPMGRYFYKVSPVEILGRVIKIAFPIVAVVIILVVFWLALPRVKPPIEDMESAVNRILYSIKKDGLSSKLTSPFPTGYSISSWEFINKGAESEVMAGGLGEALKTFKTTFSEEIVYDEAKKALEEMERTLKANKERISEIDETVAALNTDKAKYIDLVSNNRLDPASIEREYQKEVKTFKDDFSSLEDRVKGLERDIADVKNRIARYEAIYGTGGDDPGYIANKMELDDLTKEYGKGKPLYDKRKANYDDKLRSIRQQYQNMLDDTLWLDTVDAHLVELGQEKARLFGGNKIFEKEIKDAKGKFKVLETERAKRPKLTGDNLIMFLLLSHYIDEKKVDDIDAISMLERYRIYKTVSHVNLTLSGKGKEQEGRYDVTFMRLQTEKSVIVFVWNKDSTTWVLTSIGAAK